MLRALLALLLLANLAWWGATHGWLPASWLPFPDDQAQREPGRLARQVRPEAVTIRPAGTGSAAPPACLQTGPFATTEELATAEAALLGAGLPASRWEVVSEGAGRLVRVSEIDDEARAALRRAQDNGLALGRCP